MSYSSSPLCKLVETDDERCRCTVCGRAKPRDPRGCGHVCATCHPDQPLSAEQITRDRLTQGEIERNRKTAVTMRIPTPEEVERQRAYLLALPGSQLQRIITTRLGQQAIAGCGCTSMISQMNRWGVAGCRRNLDAITDRLVDIATKREWVLGAEDGVDPADVGKPVPQTRRTKFLRLLSRAVSVTDAGKDFVRGRCRAMATLAIRRSERETSKLK